jgi:hypothetical protein
MHNVWADSGTQDEPNASMDRQTKFSHACHADDLARGDRDRSNRVGCDREAVLGRSRIDRHHLRRVPRKPLTNQKNVALWGIPMWGRRRRHAILMQ